ncbi:ricin-type beta-trefoil lectin domain protein [Arenivirga flava]|uniref:Ricin B lectin domain-containing protein n=1 Tax=Arenivirga flava TaxID=1930060 RepID=A0AA37UNV1_9MICO|nr:ricin-type beta-trefoil lectin domain protein [Arenivirga flava]GMA28386.1 hypothetical protein GCM10025874_16390 [Arenivirga flava]
MEQLYSRRLIAGLTGTVLAAGLAITGIAPAAAYQPTASPLFTAQNPASCNKNPCVLYPKTAQLPSGRLVAAFEDSQTAPVGQTMPIHVSDDQGTTWRSLAKVVAPAYASSDPQYAKYTSNWTNPHLYVLPQAVGALPAGTLLLATVVSGDDAYAAEQKAADPNWRPTGDGDRRDVAIALYASSDEGASWRFLNVIAQGGWQGGSAGAIGRTAAANSARQVDPVWEPHLIARNGQLVAYYSDENDYLGFDPQTGVPTIDPQNASAPDSHGQILVHRTWDGRSAGWSQPVVDAPGLTQDRGNGKRQIGGGRPGMTTVAPTVDGRWMMTFEFFGGGSNTRVLMADDPLRFFATGDADGAEIGTLPVPSGQRGLSAGGSPVTVALPDGRLIYNAAGSGSVWVNESGRSDGQWKEFQSSVPGGYSRNLQYVEGTGRVLIAQAGWSGGSTGPVLHADLDIGRTDSAYGLLVNRKTGQVLSPQSGRTQDANLTGDTPDLLTVPRSGAGEQQRWSAETRNGLTTFLNKSGGRSIATWTGQATAGQSLAQWVDDGASDKQWRLVPTSDGFVTMQSARNASLYVTAGGNGSIALQNALPSSDNDAQEWQYVTDASPLGVPFSLRGANSNRCLDVPNGASGAQLQVWDCVGNANQRFTRTAADEIRIGDRCLAADGNGVTAGTKAILWPCNGSTSQRWAFRTDGTIGNLSNGLNLDVAAFGTANGSAVQLWSPTGSATQRWAMQ